ncbi:hypothetical protein MJO29_009104 [Puccinia striiformis f. sp. tritici]|nr:hypothetical protein MJO29_009104 [Puccinia striiformis f. sp. tritici]
MFQTQHFRAVVKSQIAHVLFSCMAKVKDTESLRQDMAGLSGQEYIQQSHKCRLTTDSIDSFLQMAAQYDPFCKFDKVYSFVPAAITNIYKKGMKYIKENSKSTNIDKINRFNPAYTLSYVTFQIDDPGSDEEQELTTRTKNLN